MRLHHTQDVPEHLDAVWERFVDLRQVGACFPGAAVTSLDGPDFVGQIRVTLGPLTLTYDGQGRLDLTGADDHRAVVTATGQERHGLGKADITITVELSPASGERVGRVTGGRAKGGQGTHVDVQTVLDVHGAPTDLGGGLAQRVSDPLVGAFIACMGGAGPSGDGQPLDLGRSVLPDLARSVGRSLRDRVRGRR